jgi:hypothetical protein
MMPVRQKRKNRQGSRQTFWRIERPSATTWRRNGTPTKPEQTTGAIWPGPCERKGNHGLESPRRLGAANGLPVPLVRRYRPHWRSLPAPAPSPTPPGGL